MRPRALIFDLDHTLLDPGGNPEAMRRTCAEVAAGLPGLDTDRLLQANAAVWQTYWPQVEHSWLVGALDTVSLGAEIWRRALAACGHNDRTVALQAHLKLQAYQMASYRLYEDVAAALDAFAARTALALITNGASDLQREKLRVTGLETRFEAIVVSGEVGVAKPDAGIFRLALERLDVDPAGAWYVGDNPRADVVGARSAGLNAVWLNRDGAPWPGPAPAPGHEVATLSALAHLFD